MAALPITVEIRTPLPVDVRDLPVLERLAHQATEAHRVDPLTVTMRQDDNDLVLTYEMTAE